MDANETAPEAAASVREASEGTEPGVVSDLTDLSELSLSDLADAVKTGTTAPEETLHRVAPSDGTQLLVAASFQSAI